MKLSLPTQGGLSDLFMQCRIADLRCKEVVNVCDGERLGFVEDVLIDTVTGRMVAIVVPGRLNT